MRIKIQRTLSAAIILAIVGGFTPPMVAQSTDSAKADGNASGDDSQEAARRKILEGVGYYDAGGALDVSDVINQLEWFRAQGLVKGDADPATMIDTRFLPTR